MHTHESVADSDAHPPHCPACKRTMLLSGIEWDTEVRDLYTFACVDCAQREVRSVLATATAGRISSLMASAFAR